MHYSLFPENELNKIAFDYWSQLYRVKLFFSKGIGEKTKQILTIF